MAGCQLGQTAQSGCRRIAARGVPLRQTAGIWKSGDMSEDVRVWVDGRLVAGDEPALAALDHGITVGDGAFETCKIVGGEVFAAARHLARLDRTLAGLGLQPADHARIEEGVKA